MRMVEDGIQQQQQDFTTSENGVKKLEVKLYHPMDNIIFLAIVNSQ